MPCLCAHKILINQEHFMKCSTCLTFSECCLLCHGPGDEKQGTEWSSRQWPPNSAASESSIILYLQKAVKENIWLSFERFEVLSIVDINYSIYSLNLQRKTNQTEQIAVRYVLPQSQKEALQHSGSSAYIQKNKQGKLLACVRLCIIVTLSHCL